MFEKIQIVGRCTRSLQRSLISFSVVELLQVMEQGVAFSPSIAQREQETTWELWLKSKHLRFIQPFWKSPQELSSFLWAQGCDTSIWGYQKESKPVEALHRELLAYKSCLCFTKPNADKKNPGGGITVVRCISELRVRFVNEEEQILVREVHMKNGATLYTPLKIRLRLGESPFKAAERLLFKLTGVNAHRASGGTYEDDDEELEFGAQEEDRSTFRPSSREKSSSLSMRGIRYTPLQYDNPLEYESQSSSTFPTLTTVYRLNVLTLRLHEMLGGTTESIVSFAANRGRFLHWVDKERARSIYMHLELQKSTLGTSKEKTNEFVNEEEMSHGQQRANSSVVASYLSISQDDLQPIVGNKDEQLIGQSQRFNSPASVMFTSKHRMASVLVDFYMNFIAYMNRKRRERALGLIRTTDWLTVASSQIVNNFAADHEKETKKKDKKLTRTVSLKRASSSLSTVSSTSMKAIMQRFAKDLQIWTVFHSTSFDRYGKLLPLIDCSWFKSLQKAENFGNNSIDLFRIWLQAAQLDGVEDWSEAMLKELLEETLSKKCELILLPSTRKLERVVRTAKVIVYAHGSDGQELEQHDIESSRVQNNTEGRFLEMPPSFTRRLVLQKIRLPADSEECTPIYGNGIQHDRRDSVNTFHEHLAGDEVGSYIIMDFSVMLNKKASGNQYMVEVVESIIQKYFNTKAYEVNSEHEVPCSPKIRSVYMLEPHAESNVSPTFPGLRSVYYLHQFWVRLSGIPSGNFRTLQYDKEKRQEDLFWMWIEGIQTDVLDNRTCMLDYFLQQDDTRENLLYFAKSLRKSNKGSLLGRPEYAIEEAIEWSFCNLLKTQLMEGCKSDDPLLVRYSIEKLWQRDDAKYWTTSDRNIQIMKALAVALEGKCIHAAHALLSIYVENSLKALESNELNDKEQLSPGDADNDRDNDDDDDDEEFQDTEKLLKAMSERRPLNTSGGLYPDVNPLGSFNEILVVSSLINAKQRVIQVKGALVEKKIEKFSAAPFCVLAAVKKGHARMLKLLLEMVPHFINGPFFPSVADPTRQPLWDDLKETRDLFQLTDESITLLRQATDEIMTVFVPGYYDSESHALEAVLQSHRSYSSTLKRYFSRLFKSCFSSSVGDLGREHGRRSTLGSSRILSANALRDRIKPFGWEALLAEICSEEDIRLRRPLGTRMTKVLGVVLAACPALNSRVYKEMMEMYLISIVSVCWNDGRIFGYELEAKRMIIEFLEDCHYSFHTALLITSVLRRLAKTDTYYDNELKKLYNWMKIECQVMLDQCVSQEEANSVLYEQIHVEPEFTTWIYTASEKKNLSRSEAAAQEVQGTTETSAMFMAVKYRVARVVASDWFQGTNENKIWFYEWWRPDKFPWVYENNATSFIRTTFLTIILLVELVVMMPAWCIAPFSIKVSAWQEQLAINSAYFKFLSQTLLHCVFVIIVVWNSWSTGPTNIKRGVVEPMGPVEIVMYVWVGGLMASELQAFYFDPKNYISTAVNYIDIAYLSSFAIAFLYRYISFSDFSDHDTTIYQTAGVWFNGEEWTGFGAASISEAFLALGSLLAVYRLLYLLSYHHRLGPLYTSILNMRGDFISYVIMLIIFLLGNSLAMVFILRRYVGDDGYYYPAEPDQAGMQAGMRGTIPLLGTILFSGEVPDDVVNLTPNDALIYYSIIVVHLLLVSIVLTNLLIAMMQQTYSNTQNAAMMVYLNQRMELINDYASQPVVPPPLNLLTIPFVVTALLWNHIRYGNSRAVYLKQRRSASVRDLNSLTNSFKQSSMSNGIVPHAVPSPENVKEARLEQLRLKEKYGANNSMRKVRCVVMSRYFELARKQLDMVPTANKKKREDRRSSEARLINTSMFAAQALKTVESRRALLSPKRLPSPKNQQTEKRTLSFDSNSKYSPSPTIAAYLAERTRGRAKV